MLCVFQSDALLKQQGKLIYLLVQLEQLLVQGQTLEQPTLQVSYTLLENVTVCLMIFILMLFTYIPFILSNVRSVRKLLCMCTERISLSLYMYVDSHVHYNKIQICSPSDEAASGHQVVSTPDMFASAEIGTNKYSP